MPELRQQHGLQLRKERRKKRPFVYKLLTSDNKKTRTGRPLKGTVVLGL
jgi:hypothetical protein